MTTTTTPPVLDLRAVSRRYGTGPTELIALDDVSLTVSPGELVAVTGRSGAGKSTMLNLAGGLDQPDAGTVHLTGVNLRGQKPNKLAELRRRVVGFVFQHGNLIPTLTASENVALPLELDGLPNGPAREAADEALESVGLAGHERKFPDQLSGGQQQRVAIARALVGPRSLLLADEPTAALDELTAEAVMRLLRSRIDAGAAGLLVTHDPALAAWADRVVRLRDGRIVESSRRSSVPETVYAEVAR